MNRAYLETIKKRIDRRSYSEANQDCADLLDAYEDLLDRHHRLRTMAKTPGVPVLSKDSVLGVLDGRAALGGDHEQPTPEQDRERDQHYMTQGWSDRNPEQPTPPFPDHPYTDPGDGREQCPTCGKWVWYVTHSCKGIRVAPPAVAGPDNDPRRVR